MSKGRGVPIGLKNLVYALLEEDPAFGGKATYGPVKNLVGAITANVNPNSSTETLFADDGPFETASTIGSIGLELGVADLSLEDQAELLGHSIVGGVMIRKGSDIPPWVAVGFKSLKSNGKYRYTWLAKGKFASPEQANQTKGDGINWNTPTISGAFVKRECDDEWERHIDEDSIDFAPAMATNWFNNPYGEASGGGGAALAVSSITPTANATAVAVGTTITVNFNQPLALSTVNTGSILLLKADGSPVAVSLSLNSERKVLTITPKADLTASNKHQVIVTEGVKDIYGRGLSTPYTSSFTTA